MKLLRFFIWHQINFIYNYKFSCEPEYDPLHFGSNEFKIANDQNLRKPWEVLNDTNSMKTDLLDYCRQEKYYVLNLPSQAMMEI